MKDRAGESRTFLRSQVERVSLGGNARTRPYAKDTGDTHTLSTLTVQQELSLESLQVLDMLEAGVLEWGRTAGVPV